MSWYSDAMDHENLREELVSTDWYKGLMENAEFRNKFEKNYSIRLRLAETQYLKNLLTNEMTRMDFVENVLHHNDKKTKE